MVNFLRSQILTNMLLVMVVSLLIALLIRPQPRMATAFDALPDQVKSRLNERLKTKNVGAMNRLKKLQNSYRVEIDEPIRVEIDEPIDVEVTNQPIDVVW